MKSLIWDENQAGLQGEPSHPLQVFLDHDMVNAYDWILSYSASRRNDGKLIIDDAKAKRVSSHRSLIKSPSSIAHVCRIRTLVEYMIMTHLPLPDPMLYLYSTCAFNDGKS
jgi:hypothetical protein